jgi:hypothetical protein
MRTTITLDPDVQVRLERLMRDRHVTFKTAVNEMLRSGLEHERTTSHPDAYVLPVRDMGLRPGIDLDRAAHLAAELEDEEMARKLALRK